MDLATFFNQYGLILLLGALLVFMFWSSRRRMQKQKLEQEEKARQTVPGSKVLMQGGLYGTIVAFDPENLDQPAVVEIAPGVEIEVHSQAILRVVTPSDELVESDEELHSDDELRAGDDLIVTDEQRELTADSAEPDAEPGSKPQA